MTERPKSPARIDGLGAATGEDDSLPSAEQPYRMLVERMQEGAATLTRDGNVLYCNRRLAELLDAPTEGIVGGPIERFLMPVDRAALAAMLGIGQGKREGHLLTAAGEPVPASLAVSTVVSDGVESLCLIVTDLSELVSMRAARAEAEAASRAKDVFVAALAHELRNPLGAIRSAVAVLEMNDEASRRRAQEVIAHQTAQLTRLVADLVEISRTTTGKIALVRAPVDLAEVVRRTVEAIEHTGAFGRRRISVAAVATIVNGDETRLEQIVTNLLTNAVKFTPSDSAITVTLAHEGDEVVLRVADSGVGIPGPLVGRVFDAFVQGDSGLARAGGGLGIGLTLVRTFVELHGGRVEATSPGPGRGSVFTVRLPAGAGASRRATGRPTP